MGEREREWKGRKEEERVEVKVSNRKGGIGCEEESELGGGWGAMGFREEIEI